MDARASHAHAEGRNEKFVAVPIINFPIINFSVHRIGVRLASAHLQSSFAGEYQKAITSRQSGAVCAMKTPRVFGSTAA